MTGNEPEHDTAVAVSPEDESSDRRQSDEDQRITVELLDSLTESADVVATAMATSARLRKWLVLLVSVFIVVLVAVGVVGGLVLNDVQNSTRELQKIAKQNKANGDVIVDCTTPQGKCFKEGQDRTARAVGTINEVTIHAVACAQEVEGDAAIKACVARKLQPVPGR